MMSDSPPPTPNQDHLDELMAGYVLDALSPQEQAEVEQILQQGAPEMREQLRSLGEVMALLAHTTQQAAPGSLRARVLSIPASSMPSQATILPLRAARRWPWRAMGGAIAASLFIALAIDNYQVRQRVSTLEAVLAEQHPTEENYAFELHGRGMATDASAIVLLDAHTGRVFVGVTNLPPLSADETYYLWAFTADDQKVLCGHFNTHATGQWVSYLSVDPAIYPGPVQVMRISREPIHTPPQAEDKTIVLSSEVL